MRAPLAVHGVVHLVRASGIQARDLAELRAGIAAATDASLFHHAHHPRLRHPFAPSPPPNDFSAWVAGVMQDRETAERLSFAVQTGGASAGALRTALLAVLPQQAGRGSGASRASESGPFTFLELDAVPVDLGLMAHDPDELMLHLIDGNLSLYFHHVTERPWFAPAHETIAGWVRGRGEERLAGWLEECAHDGRPLAESRRRLARRWLRSRVVHRLTESAGLPEGVRQSEARRVVSGLVRRLKEG